MATASRRTVTALVVGTGFALVAVGGCSGPFVSPLAAPPYRGHISASYDDTWKAFIRALAIDNVSVRAVEKDSGVIASDDFVSTIGVYADCGRVGDVVLEGEALVSFTVFAQPGRTGGTDFQVNSKMRTQQYRRGSSGRLRAEPAYPCVSTGRWEANLSDTVRRLVKE